MALRTGKLPPELLRKLLKYGGAKDSRVLQGPDIGEDAAVVRLGKSLLVLKTDPVTYASEMVGWYAVNVNANDVATRGARPAWFQAAILLPEGSDEKLAESIFRQISEACKELDIAVTGGHTEVTPGIDHPIVVGDMHGVVIGKKAINTGGARTGDLLVMTKSAGIEGTALIAREKKAELTRVFKQGFVTRAADYLKDPGLSIVPEAMEALKFNVTAMHDPTEGGVSMGAWELARASGRSVELWADQIKIRRETEMLCSKYELNPLGLLGSGSLLATFAPKDAARYVARLEMRDTDVAVVGKIVSGKDRSRTVTKGVSTELSSSERDEVLKVLSP